MEQADCDPARQNTNASGEQHKAPIMVDRQAIEDLEHLWTGLMISLDRALPTASELKRRLFLEKMPNKLLKLAGRHAGVWCMRSICFAVKTLPDTQMMAAALRSSGSRSHAIMASPSVGHCIIAP
jgi:hypothetical protein